MVELEDVDSLIVISFDEHVQERGRSLVQVKEAEHDVPRETWIWSD